MTHEPPSSGSWCSRSRSKRRTLAKGGTGRQRRAIAMGTGGRRDSASVLGQVQTNSTGGRKRSLFALASMERPGPSAHLAARRQATISDECIGGNGTMAR